MQLAERIREKAERFEPPGVNEIDPSFIFLSPTVWEKTEFEALDTYREPVEPEVVEFDPARHKEDTVRAADEFIDALQPRLDRLDDDYDRIFEVIAAKRYRSGTMKATRFEENRELFRPVIQRHIDDGTPLEVVLPSFPYKFNTPFKVARKSPDMAEVLCLSQMYEISRSLSRVHPPGVRFTIISDGRLYHSIFGITRYEALEYRARVGDMIRDFGFGDHLDLVDMDEDIIEPVREHYEAVRARMRPVLETWWRRHPRNKRRASLLANSAPNINSATEIANDLVRMATKDILLETDDKEVLVNFERLRRAVRDRSERGAFEFALVLYTLKELDLVMATYPGAIRATVHPKPGQWGLHLVNRHTQVFPWQGVAYRSGSGRWTVRYEFDAIRRRAVPMHLDGELFPFYYQDPEARSAA